MELTETVATQVCYTPAEYYTFLDGITQGTMRFGMICIVVGYIAGRFTPIVIARLRVWWNGRTAQ
jgi:hypothetical protein